MTDGGSITDVLGKIFTQATQGAKEGATRVGEATGASDALGRADGRSENAQILEQLKAIVQNSPFAAGTAAGGLGGLVLGTRAGRSIAANAVRIGALAMIGGLAYKAVQNYQAGKPLDHRCDVAGIGASRFRFRTSCGYERCRRPLYPGDDRRSGRRWPHRCRGARQSFRRPKQAGVDREAEAFLATRIEQPALGSTLSSFDYVAAGSRSNLYGRAHCRYGDLPAEKQFLTSLAQALSIDPKLAAHIDATAASAAA